MKNIIAFNTVKDVYDILGLKYNALYYDEPQYEELWDAGFNFDDWDIGFACKEPLCRIVKDEDEYEYYEWSDDVRWLGMRMENYCVGVNICEYGGYYWYTVHHS